MATIALYSGKINQMPGLINDIKKSVGDYKSELFSLKNKTLSVNRSVCNLDDVVSSIQSSTQTQDQKITSLEKFSQQSETFISNVVRIDGNAADAINKNKDDFYNEYYYLKPNCEKNGWEKFCDGFKSVGEWCKEHWKLIVTIVIVVVAVILICTGVGGIIGAMAIGALLGTAIGGIAGGTISALSGGSFWEGFENGAFNGAITGIISGGMGVTLSASGTAVLKLGQTMLIGGVSGVGASLVGDIGNKYIKGDNISWGQIGVNALFTGTISAAFAGAGFGIAKAFGALLKNVSWFSESKELFRIGKTASSKYGWVTSYSTSDPQGISLNFANGAGTSVFRVEFDAGSYLHYHLRSLFNSTKRHIPLSPILDSAVSTNISNYIKE